MNLWDVSLEREVLSICLSGHDETMEAIADEDFWALKHRLLFRATKAVRDTGHMPDPNSVMVELDRLSALEGITNPVDRGEVIEMYLTGTWKKAPALVSRLLEYTQRRQLHDLGCSVAEKMKEGFPIDEVSIFARDGLEMVGSRRLVTEPPVDASVFCGENDEYDWLVEGVLERGERIVVTGPEGKGKSTLCRQWAVCFAAGVHPWNFYPTPKLRVLIVDLENSASQIRRSLRPLMHYAKLDDGLSVAVRLQGLDMKRVSDQRWLLDQVRMAQPDVLVTGPIYKMTAGDPKDEETARVVAGRLDDIRERFNCAVILEGHSPHGNTADRDGFRPYGASLWLRWPEYGLALIPHRSGKFTELRPWRGARDQARVWPRRLVSSPRWPWVALSEHDEEEMKIA